MMASMAERIRIAFDTDEEVRLALNMASVKLDISQSALINRIIRESLAEEIKIVSSYMPRGKDKKK